MAEVIFASCYDEKYPPQNVLDSSSKKFFSSTGNYPQEICLQFENAKPMRSVTVSGFGIKHIVISSCESDSVVNFEKQAEQSEVPNSSRLQQIKLDLTKNPKVRVLKIEVLEGYEDFFSIHNVGFS